MGRGLSNVVGFDDAPFEREHRGQVLLVGAVCSRTRLDGVVSGTVERDGGDSADVMIEVLRRSQFGGHVQAVLLQGIAVAGFNVVDIHRLHEQLGVPVVVVARRTPDLDRMRSYLEHNVPDWRDEWALLVRSGEMEPLRGLRVQRVGIDRSDTGRLLATTTLHGNLPEALRLAHLIAGGVTTGASRGRA